MSRPEHLNYKRSYEHSFSCCKQYLESKIKYNSKSSKPPSTVRLSYSTSLSNKAVRHVPPFSIQSQQKNTIVLNGPLISFSEKTSAQAKSIQNCNNQLNSKTNYSELIFTFVASGK